MANEKLLTVKLPFGPFARLLRERLREKLERFASQMRRGVAQGTSPASPSWWAGNIQSYVQVEDLGFGYGCVTFGVGLIDGTPEQALWQAYIFNFGSGQFGKNGMITSKDVFYNVDTGGFQYGLGAGVKQYPQFAKQKNRWFDDVVETEMTLGQLNSLVARIVKEVVNELFSSGAWQIKGHHMTIHL